MVFDEKRSITWADLRAALDLPRLGLQSPYIEHFGQALARFYMRVGLPEDMPEIRWDRLEYQPGRQVSQAVVTPDRFARAGLRASASPLKIRLQRFQLSGCPDVLCRAQLDLDGSYFGIGESEEDAIGSLVYRLVRKRNEMEGKPLAELGESRLLLSLFP